MCTQNVRAKLGPLQVNRPRMPMSLTTELDCVLCSLCELCELYVCEACCVWTFSTKSVKATCETRLVQLQLLVCSLATELQTQLHSPSAWLHHTHNRL